MFESPFLGKIIAWTASGHGHAPTDRIAETLIRQGYPVTSIEAESDVLRSVLETVPDLLLIYLQTARDKGYSLCEHLRQLPQTSHLPIVFIGNRNETAELVAALRCGGNEYLQLSTEEKECWLRIEHHLKTSKIVQRLQTDTANLYQQIESYDRIMRQQAQHQNSLSKKIETLQKLAYIDDLTQVGNRYSFNQNIAKIWQQACSTGNPVSLLLCDIDYFKRYNDTYGHIGGDVCLRTVAQALVRGSHRHGDRVARYGGEEFSILLPDTDSRGGQTVALSIQAELARLQIPHQKSLVKPYVSMSIGLCTLRPESGHTSYEVIIHGADEALYTAKLRGRDRLVINSPNGLITVLPPYSDNPQLDDGNSRQHVVEPSWHPPNVPHMSANPNTCLIAPSTLSDTSVATATG